MKAVTALLHQKSLSHLISSCFFDLTTYLVDAVGGGGAGRPQKFTH